MKKLWYYFMRTYVSLGFSFYYKNILVRGKQNIPKRKAVMFISNHPNALIDPLIVATTNSRITHYLTQAAVFKSKIVRMILNSVNMLPVYRVRDGIGSEKLISYNEQIFNKCYDILNDKEAILIYVEGSHNFRRKVRPFKKGFARIVFGAMDKYNDLDIDIIPVGMNYVEVDAYASNMCVNYGKPIPVRSFWEMKDRNEAIKQLKTEAESKLKLVANHITDTENYDKIITYFEPNEFLYPEKVHEKLKYINLKDPSPVVKNKNSRFNLLELLVRINSFFPLLIWNKIKLNIKEKEYVSTFRFAVGLTAFPIFYLIQTGVVSYFFGSNIGWIYLFISLLIFFLLTKTKR